MRFFSLGLAVVALGLGRLSVPSHNSFGEDCRPLDQPKDLPRLDAVLDSIGLHRRLQTLDTMPSAEVIISVFLSDKPRAHVVEKEPQTFTEDSLVGHVLSSLRPRSKNSPIAFRVHLQLGPARSITLERPVLCAPTAQGTLGEVRVGRVVVDGRSPPLPEPRPFTARIRISPDGHVLQVSLGSGTGINDLDRALRDAMLKQRYDPALLDGRPVEVWIEGKRVDLVR